MKRLAALTLALIFLFLTGLFGPTTPSAEALGAAQPIDDTPSRLRLDIDDLGPRMITADSGALSVTGRITNTGDRQISNVRAQFQLGERQTTERQLGESLADPPPTDSARSNFADVAVSLAPGESVPLSIAAPLNEPGGLSIGGPGVYPLLVNVNGKPEYGGEARLAALSTMLPVLSSPGTGETEEPGAPTGLTVLWPIADLRPRVQDAPFGDPAATTLTDDDLARDLAPGGRLDALVSAARSAFADQRLSAAVCFAIDPDLLETVVAMGRGYQVQGERGVAPGQGQEAANNWLNGLRQLVAGRCVVPLPYADADLNTLARIEPEPARTELISTAVGGSALIENVLGVRTVEGVLWPDGAFDPSTLTTLQRSRISTLITDPARLSTESSTGAVDIEGGGEDAQLRAQQFDPLLARAMAGSTGRPQSAAGSATPADEPDIATQDGLAALAFRAGLGNADEEGTSGPVLLAPPRHWNAPTKELTHFLDVVGDLTDAGMVAPTSLQQQLSEPTNGTAAMAYSAAEITTETPSEITGAMTSIEADLGDLRGAMTLDPTAQVAPDAVLQPVRNAVIRGSSTVWRGDTTAATAATRHARQQLDALRSRVRIDAPGQVLSLPSGSSSLPVYIKNELPVTINVRVDLSEATGLRAEETSLQPIPAWGARNAFIPAEVLRSGRFSVNVALTTPSGDTDLGPIARFDLTSSEYGVITIVLTISAAAALLLLSGRRIYKRIRARRHGEGPADYPGATETVVDAGR